MHNILPYWVKMRSMHPKNPDDDDDVDDDDNNSYP